MINSLLSILKTMNIDIAMNFCQNSMNYIDFDDKMKKILVLNGPNLNRLGTREPSIYGKTTLHELHAMLKKQAQLMQAELTCLQTNSEAEFIDAIHQATDDSLDYLIVNAAAYTHTSIAIRDALIASNIPFIEVHLSNIYARETFRHHSYLSDIAQGVICGFGVKSYTLALQTILDHEPLNIS
jgi:3-dehydroquinate dehydratase II